MVIRALGVVCHAFESLTLYLCVCVFGGGGAFDGACGYFNIV